MGLMIAKHQGSALACLQGLRRLRGQGMYCYGLVDGLRLWGLRVWGEQVLYDMQGGGGHAAVMSPCMHGQRGLSCTHAFLYLSEFPSWGCPPYSLC